MKIPGFIDLQVNGYIGINFSEPDLTEKTCEETCRALLSHGTAGFLPTIITNSMENYCRNIPIISKVMKKSEFRGRLLGIHLEGPFISPEPGAVGAHNPEWVIKPDVDILRKFIELSENSIKLITIAADVDGAAELAEFATANGITVSLGHQLASAEDYTQLIDAGAVSITHFGNGIPNMLNRHINPLFPVLGEDNLTTMLIADGHHVPTSFIKTVLKIKGIDNVIVVSDAAPVAGLPPGKYYMLGNDAILEESGLFHNPEKECMVGSSSTMLECMNFLASTDIMSLEELIQVAYYNPLRLINVDPAEILSPASLSYNPEKRKFAVS
ncbi:MAG: amidohydrolase family protein [Verrucomicrobiota bacterium]|nr:amidohydrolase family protein [Verrucomicrobiota bacterium]